MHLYTQFAQWPETTFFPWIISKGLLPYRDFFDIHNPAVYYLNGFIFKFFGVNAKYLRWEMTLVMLCNTAGVFHLVKRVFDPWRGMVAAICFVLLEVGFFGNGIWFDQFVLGFLLVAAGYLLRYPEDGFGDQHGLVLGFIFGIGALFKQTIVWAFFGSTVLIVIWSAAVLGQPWRRVLTKVLWLGTAALVPLIVHVIVLAFLGAAEPYLYSTVYLPLFDYSYPRLPGRSFVLRFLIWLVLAVEFLYIHLRSDRDSKKVFAASVIFVFFLTSLLMDYPTHGRVHLVPAAAFLSMIAADLTFRCNKRTLWIALFLIPFLIWTVVDHVRFVSANFGSGYRFAQVAPEPSAAWITRNTGAQERIYATQDLLFYVRADRLPATTNVYQYWWLMHGRYGSQSIIHDLEQQKPRFVVMSRDQYENRADLPAQTAAIFGYIFRHYNIVPRRDGNIVILKRIPD